MDMPYKVKYDQKFYKDLSLIELRTNTNYYRKLKNKIDIILEDLQYMPRLHKTLYSSKNPSGEYRRIIIEKYSIIYKIVDNEIIILRIFNQKQNYLNSKTFTLKEKSQKYIVIK